MKPLVFGLALILSAPIFAAEQHQVETDQSQINKTTMDHYNQSFWGLNNSEWAKYQQVKPIAKLFGQSETTPVEVLGIFAETDAERKRYAGLFVQKMDAYLANLLEFQKTTAQLQAEYYKNIPMLDPDKMNELRNAPIRTSDRIQFFTKPNCSSCDLMLLKLIRQVRMYGAKLDVFFEGATAEQVQQYAQKKVPKGLVEKGLITLNVDNGYIAKYKIQTPAPYISKAGGALKHHDPDL